MIAAAQSAETPIPLHVAVQKGLVKVDVTGRGHCSGDAVHVSVQRTPAAGHVVIDVTPGTIIETSSQGVQSMALQKVTCVRVGTGNFQKTTQIDLADDAPRVCVLVGFCRDFSKKMPQTEHHFQIHDPDAGDQRLIEHAAGLSASVKVTQAALWIKRENVADADLKKRYRLSDDEVQAARQVVVSVNNPAANVDVKVYLDKIAERVAAWRERRINAGDIVVTTQAVEAERDGNRKVKKDRRKDKKLQDVVKLNAGTRLEVVRNGFLGKAILVKDPAGGAHLHVPVDSVQRLCDSNRRLEQVAGVMLEGFDLIVE